MSLPFCLVYSGFTPYSGPVAGHPDPRPLLMSEPPSARFTPSQKQKSLLERLTAFIFREPENREELLEALHDAHERNLLDADAMSMIEGCCKSPSCARAT
jgi:hypothetical protein